MYLTPSMICGLGNANHRGAWVPHMYCSTHLSGMDTLALPTNMRYQPSHATKRSQCRSVGVDGLLLARQELEWGHEIYS